MKRSQVGSTALVALGLSELEAEIFNFLLRESPATGYRVAQALGRQFSNVYKAIESLESRGAVQVVDQQGVRYCRAVPIAEFLSRLERSFSENCAAAAALAGPTDADTDADVNDDLLYPILDRAQLFDRCRSMLRAARLVINLTACPVVAAELHDTLRAVDARVALGVKVFEPIELPNATVIVDPRGSSALEAGPGQWVSLNVDGREFVLGLLTYDGEQLLHGYWCRGPFQAWIHYSGHSSDLLLAALRARLHAGDDRVALQALLERLAPLESPVTLGKQLLIQRYRPAIRRRGQNRASTGEAKDGSS